MVRNLMKCPINDYKYKTQNHSFITFQPPPCEMAANFRLVKCVLVRKDSGDDIRRIRLEQPLVSAHDKVQSMPTHRLLSVIRLWMLLKRQLKSDSI